MHYDPASEVIIHLRGGALIKAKLAVRKTQGVRAALAYKGPHFRDTDKQQVDIAIGSSTVNVGISYKGSNKAEEYIYPLHSVGRVKVIGN